MTLPLWVPGASPAGSIRTANSPGKNSLKLLEGVKRTDRENNVHERCTEYETGAAHACIGSYIGPEGSVAIQKVLKLLNQSGGKRPLNAKLH